MSAPNPNPGERESDAVRRAQRAHEPSMEEILASIRAIIADDREAESPKAASKPAGNVASPVSHPTKDAAPVREVEAAPAKAEGSSAPVDALSPKTVSWRPRTEPSSPRAADLAAALVVRALPEIEPAVSPTSEPEPELEPEPEIASSLLEASEAPLLSEAADRAVTASFEELSSSLALHNAQLIESLTREMLRPMIKTWLDDHLPAVVERLVRAEIQRVARGGR